MGNDITRRERDKTHERPTTDTHVFHLQPFQGYRLEMGDVHFHHDSAVLLPDYDVVPDASRVTALAVLAACLGHARKNPAHKLLIAGHTDTTGRNDYNLGLSELRAKSVYYALTGDKDGWVGVAESKHKVEDYQLILKWAHLEMGYDSDPGKIDNTQGPKTAKATKRFQEQYNEDYGASIPTNGVVGAETWGAFFYLYMEVLEVLLKVDHAGLAAIQNSLKWVKDGVKMVGCGEEFPIDQPRRNAYNSKTNRRVEMLFFEPGQEPKLDCHPGPGKSQPILCEIYNPWMYRYKNIPATPIPIEVPAYDLQNVRTAVRIAPEKEKVKIEYDITNIGNLIRSGSWKILRKKDNKILKTTNLTKDQWTQGPQAVQWDGSVPRDAEFPDGFVTLEHSPYIVKVAIDGRLGPREGQTEIKVELDKFVVEKAPRDRITRDRDQKVWDSLPALPAAGLVKIKLLSNLFAVKSDEMYDDTAYSAYEQLWMVGPLIPLWAAVTILDSKGQAVRAGKALGRAKVLWDFTDPKQSEPAYLATPLDPPPDINRSPGAKKFVDDTLAQGQANTRPVDGDNCPEARGGRRPSGSYPRVPILDSLLSGVNNFSFMAARGSKRCWASFSEFEKSGGDEARTGVVFRPSRMAGDNYQIKAYLDLRDALDTEDAVPTGAEREVAVGAFEMWRQITLAAHFKKCGQVSEAMPGIAEYYTDAFIEVDDQSGGPKALTKTEYDVAFKAAEAVAGAKFKRYGKGYALIAKYALPAGVSQYETPAYPGLGGKIVKWLEGKWHDVQSALGKDSPAPAPKPTTWVATLLPYGDFKEAVQKDQALSNSALATLLQTCALGDEKAYAEKAGAFAREIATQMCVAKATKDGVTVLQFEQVSPLDGILSTYIQGNACFKTRAISGFALYRAEPGAKHVPAHEIGHCMFLPHAKRLDYRELKSLDDLIDLLMKGSLVEENSTTPKGAGEGISPDKHDPANYNCTMSYSRATPGFCGLCLLRLRGWKSA